MAPPKPSPVGRVKGRGVQEKCNANTRLYGCAVFARLVGTRCCMLYVTIFEVSWSFLFFLTAVGQSPIVMRDNLLLFVYSFLCFCDMTMLINII